MRPVKIILLLMAFGMLMTHAVIPHTHFSFQTQSLIQQQEPFGLTDIFSFNLGPEHLKTFKDGDAVKPTTTQKQLSAIPSITVFTFSAPIAKALIISGSQKIRFSPDR